MQIEGARTLATVLNLLSYHAEDPSNSLPTVSPEEGGQVLNPGSMVITNSIPTIPLPGIQSMQPMLSETKDEQAFDSPFNTDDKFGQKKQRKQRQDAFREKVIAALKQLGQPSTCRQICDELKNIYGDDLPSRYVLSVSASFSTSPHFINKGRSETGDNLWWVADPADIPTTKKRKLKKGEAEVEEEEEPKNDGELDVLSPGAPIRKKSKSQYDRNNYNKYKGKPTLRSKVIEALLSLGGEGTYTQIHKEVEKLYGTHKRNKLSTVISGFCHKKGKSDNGKYIWTLPDEDLFTLQRRAELEKDEEGGEINTVSGDCFGCHRRELSLIAVPCGHFFCGNVYCKATNSAQCAVCSAQIQTKIPVRIPRKSMSERSEEGTEDVGNPDVQDPSMIQHSEALHQHGHDEQNEAIPSLSNLSQMRMEPVLPSIPLLTQQIQQLQQQHQLHHQQQLVHQLHSQLPSLQESVLRSVQPVQEYDPIS